MQKIIKIEQIYSTTNVRNEKDDTIYELAQSIEEHGLLNPLTVVGDGNGKYRLIAGHRRYEALKYLGEPFAECNVISEYMTESEELALQMIENVQRKDMSAYELCEVFDKLREKGMSYAGIARTFHKSTQWVANNYEARRILEREYQEGIPEEKKKLSNGEIRAAYRRKQSGEYETTICNGMVVRRSGHKYMISCNDYAVETQLNEFINNHK